MTDRQRRSVASVVPNTLSVLRLAAAAGLAFVPEGWRLGVVLFAGISDFVDGLIARWFGVTSFLGGVLDVAADKLFTVAAVVTFWAGGDLAWWQAPLLLARDLAIVAVAGRVVSRCGWSGLRRLRPSLLGKATTLVLFALFVALAAWPSAVPWALGAASTMSVLAAADYCWRYAGSATGRRGRHQCAFL